MSEQLALDGMDPEVRCACRHPRWMHDLGRLAHPEGDRLLKDREKYCFSHNGVCGKRACPCAGFKAKTLIPPPVLTDLPLEWLLSDEDLESVGDVDNDQN